MATLITGLGYMGSALARRLLDEGEEVVGIDNFFSTPREPVEALAGRGVHLVEGSISDPHSLECAFNAARVDTVFHLAAQASAHADAAPLSYTQETNFTGPRLLLDACLAHGVRRAVFASSMRLYRTPLPRRITEAAPLAPPDLVHLSQLYGEMLLRAYSRQGFEALAVRLGIVHGVGPVMKTDPRFLAAPQRFCLQAARREPLLVATGAAAVLAFVHLEDVVEALVRCRDVASPTPTVANVAAEVRSVASVAEAVRDAGTRRGIDVRIEYAGRSRRYRAREIVSVLDAAGLKPTRTIEDSVGEVLDYYQRKFGVQSFEFKASG